MRAHFSAVVALACLNVGCALGRRHPQFNTIAPAIHTVAVLPFSFQAPLEPGKLDAAGGQRVAESIRRSAFLHLQQRRQDGKLTTALQSMQETDTRLAAATIDSTRAGPALPAVLADVVGADAVLYAVITEFDDPSTGGEAARTAASLALGGILGSLVSSKGGKITLTYYVYRASTHDVLWEFPQSMSAGAFKGPEDMLAKIGTLVAKQFPFKR